MDHELSEQNTAVKSKKTSGRPAFVVILALLLILSLVSQLMLLRRLFSLEGNLRNVEFASSELKRRVLKSNEQEAATVEENAAESTEKKAVESKVVNKPGASENIPADLANFVAEQRKALTYLADKVEYVYDTARLLETLALFDDAQPQERVRLQQDLDLILNRRAQSKSQFEESNRLYGDLVKQLLFSEEISRPQQP